MRFGDLNINDVLYVMHSDNTLEEETIKTIKPHNELIHITFTDSPIVVKADPKKSIYFDEDPDVILFTNKHNLFSGKIER